MNINDLLKLAVERRASDLHLKVGSHPVIRVDGELRDLVAGQSRRFEVPVRHAEQLALGVPVQLFQLAAFFQTATGDSILSRPTNLQSHLGRIPP